MFLRLPCLLCIRDITSSLAQIRTKARSCICRVRHRPAISSLILTHSRIFCILLFLLHRFRDFLIPFLFLHPVSSFSRSSASIRSQNTPYGKTIHCSFSFSHIRFRRDLSPGEGSLHSPGSGQSSAVSSLFFSACPSFCLLPDLTDPRL